METKTQNVQGFPKVQKTFFIANTRFGEKEAIEEENRPFKSVEEMDDALILNWNRVVGKNDIVYILGDFGTGGILGSLYGDKIFLKKGWFGSSVDNWNIPSDVGGYIYDGIRFTDNVVLSYRPVKLPSSHLQDMMGIARVNFYCKAEKEDEVLFRFSNDHICVAAQEHDYTPRTFNELINWHYHGRYVLSNFGYEPSINS